MLFSVLPANVFAATEIKVVHAKVAELPLAVAEVSPAAVQDNKQ